MVNIIAILKTILNIKFQQIYTMFWRKILDKIKEYQRDKDFLYYPTFYFSLFSKQTK